MIPVRRRGLLGGGLAVAGLLPLSRFARAQEDQVNIYNWDTYIGSDTLAEFTDATGISVRYDLYASSDELFGKLREGNPGYDVIFPSNNYVERMVAGDMLMPLDHALVPNLKNIAPAFANPSYDPGLKYGAPYTYSLLVIGYRRSAVAEPPTSWAAVFGPDAPVGRVSLPNETDLVRVALKSLGKSLNTEDPADLKAAEELLLEVKRRGVVKMFAPDTGQDLLLSGEVDIAVDWMGDLRQVMAEDDDLNFVVPSEGTVLGIDCMCIPKGAPHPAAAHAFIDFVLRPEVHAAIAEEIQYAIPNQPAVELLPAETRDDPQVYPPADVLAKSEVPAYRGEAAEKLFEDVLTRVLAA
ncbi:ABC transporter substrate-binding protein [Geminicoccus flavidas]|uniref:ABC transporter substrate-binding protein n=1 Tax=Geminicoccus flavidas TaxID=2506407 RepID=UPI00135B9E6A|nr:spermidine/putrescine ABC transporter substrate-binding protein [Geminicoccus flavidas]